MVSREEFKKKLLNLLNNSNLSKKLDKNTGNQKVLLFLWEVPNERL